MAQILKGKPVAQSFSDSIKLETAALKEKGIVPVIGIIRVGTNPDDISYENSIIKSCRSVGIESKVFTVEENVTMDGYIELIKRVNADPNVHGILPFRPLPKHLNEDILKGLMNPEKDIDCIGSINLHKVFSGETDGFVPCTPAAVIEILKYYNIPIKGANVIVIGRSMVVGKPLSMMLLNENATVTICHSKTRDVYKFTSEADIVVAAIGKARSIGRQYFSERSVVIDVGINDVGDGKICGDVDYEDVCDIVKSITPVPGGVGSVTTSILLKHLLTACKRQIGIKTEKNS